MHRTRPSPNARSSASTTTSRGSVKSGVDIEADTLRSELVAKVRNEIGAVATFRDVTVVPALPKTRSGKILRKTMRQIADLEEYTVPSTIEDPDVLTALAEQLKG